MRPRSKHAEHHLQDLQGLSPEQLHEAREPGGVNPEPNPNQFGDWNSYLLGHLDGVKVLKNMHLVFLSCRTVDRCICFLFLHYNIIYYNYDVRNGSFSVHQS